MRRSLAALISLAFSVIAAAAFAQQTSSVELQLNKFESMPNTCRLHVVANNPTKEAYPELLVDLVFFDGEGGILVRQPILVPIEAQREVVRTYDILDLDCEVIARIHLNAVRCSEAVDAQSCFDRVGIHSRADVSLTR